MVRGHRLHRVPGRSPLNAQRGCQTVDATSSHGVHELGLFQRRSLFRTQFIRQAHHLLPLPDGLPQRLSCCVQIGQLLMGTQCQLWSHIRTVQQGSGLLDHAQRLRRLHQCREFQPGGCSGHGITGGVRSENAGFEQHDGVLCGSGAIRSGSLGANHGRPERHKGHQQQGPGKAHNRVPIHRRETRSVPLDAPSSSVIEVSSEFSTIGDTGLM